MISVVIAAHNEAAVIGRCLDALLAQAAPGEFDITVVANGCTDRTAAAATRPGVRVVELTAAGKPGALNAGDSVAQGFPRVYLDADIVLTTAGLRTIAQALDDTAPPGGASRGGASRGAVPLAVVPRRELDLTGSPLAVRAYFAINRRLPVYRDGLFGRGVIALSEKGRARFGEFPNMVADDLFLDSQFASADKREVTSVIARVATPRRTRDLLRRLVRVRAGNAAMRAAAGTANAPRAVRSSARMSWLRDVVLPRPWLAPAAVYYVGLTVTAGYLAGRSTGDSWGRDESSRQVDRPPPALSTQDVASFHQTGNE